MNLEDVDFEIRKEGQMFMVYTNHFDGCHYMNKSYHLCQIYLELLLHSEYFEPSMEPFENLFSRIEKLEKKVRRLEK